MSKQLILSKDKYSFYSDYTYRYGAWPVDEYSKWKIVARDVLVNHTKSAGEWYRVDGRNSSKFLAFAKEAKDIIEFDKEVESFLS